MPGYRLRFGSFDLPSTLLPVDDGGGQDIAAQDLARMPGAATQEGRTRSRQLVVRGPLHGTTPNNWFTAVDALLAACDGTADLWYGRDDVYYKDAQLESWGRSTAADGRLWGAIGNFSFTFTAARYPEPFGTTTYTPSLTSAGGTVNYSQGNAPTLPTWTITINAGGTGPLTLTNSTTGETCAIAIPGASFAAADVIVLNRTTGQATLNGVLVPGLFDRRIPRLISGNNTITLTAGGTATLTSLAVSYIARFKK